MDRGRHRARDDLSRLRQRVPAILGRLRSVSPELFPSAPAPTVSARSLLCGLVAFVVGTALLLARQTGAGALDTLYAEDGRIFLDSALRHSTWTSLHSPYMGYVHLVPRLLAEVVSLAPIGRAALLFASLSAMIVAALALFVFHATAAHIQSTPIRVVLASTMVLLPVAQEEVLNNAANLHWFLIFASAWVLLWRPATNWELGLGASILLFTGLSDPLTILLAPLAALRLLMLKGRRNQVLTAAFAAGVVLQLVAIVVTGAEREGLSATANLPKLAAWYLFYVVAQALVGARWLGNTATPLNAVLAGVAILLVATLVTLALARGSLSRLAVVLAALSVLVYLAPATATGLSPPRYSVVPVLLLFSAVAELIDHTSLHQSGWRARLVLASVLAALLVSSLSNLRVPNRRSEGPRWSNELARGRAACTSWRTDDTAAVPITPPGWVMDLHCRDLR